MLSKLNKTCAKLIINKALRSFISFLLHTLSVLKIYSLMRKNITILMYHKVDICEDVVGLSIRPEIFEKQMEFLKRNYNVITLDEAVERINTGKIDNKYIVVTFDDGYRDNYTYASPILDKYNVPATFFLSCNPLETGDFFWESINSAILSSQLKELDLDTLGIGRLPLNTREDKIHAILTLHSALKKISFSDMQACISEILKLHGTAVVPERSMLNVEEVKEMIQNPLITIGSHTISHPILTRVDREQALEEIRGSKQILEELFGCQIRHFSYPNGTDDDFNSEIENMVKDSGYRSACSTSVGFNAVKDTLFKLRRLDVTDNSCLNVFGDFSESSFEVFISGEIASFKRLLFRKNGFLHCNYSALCSFTFINSGNFPWNSKRNPSDAVMPCFIQVDR